MHDLLLFGHLLGLMLGAGGGFGSGVVMGAARKLAPEQAAPLRAVGPTLARMSLAGVVLLWITGLGMVFATHGGFDALPAMFWAKMVFIVTLTIASVAVNIIYGRVKAGDAKLAAWLPRLGPAAGVSALLATLFAVLTFH